MFIVYVIRFFGYIFLENRNFLRSPANLRFECGVAQLDLCEGVRGVRSTVHDRQLSSRQNSNFDFAWHNECNRPAQGLVVNFDGFDVHHSTQREC